MELEITEQNDNPLLSRQEIKVVIKHNEDSTPRRNQVIKNLAEQLKANRELVIIDHLKNAYGKTETHGYAKVYSDKESLTRIETKPSIDRHKDIDSHSSEKKAEETAPSEEQSSEEAPSEEPSTEEGEKTDE
tara:strand:- start:101 stop:496 length:396 start_codon:yes stop_codon:yes gene_type:complete